MGSFFVAGRSETVTKADAVEMAPALHGPVRRFAQTGDYEIGQIYEFGYGVSESDERALEWYEKAWRLDPNDEQIAFEFGKALEDSDNRGHEALEAFERVVALADVFESSALNHIAKIYRRGIGGVPVDMAKAVSYYGRAAERGIGCPSSGAGLRPRARTWCAPRRPDRWRRGSCRPGAVRSPRRHRGGGTPR